MPYIDIKVSAVVGAEKKDGLQKKIGEAISLLPGKTIDNTMLCITDDCSLFMRGKPLEGAFVEIRLYKASPADNKKAFAEKLFKLLEESLGIAPGNIYLNYLEMPDWGANGTII
ncbi:MAG: phenylpyruvate tautomerase MIF-related protein [Defluviitaleaceae bacterium]|nr:phenylpyruvate tautomerase MIF-related protein [Defluviitaleaceae bacterium]